MAAAAVGGQGAIPVVFSEALNLPSLGIAAEHIKFGSCSMQSDKFICVCETGGDASQLVIVDLQNGNAVQRRPAQSTEAAIMNPVSKVIVLRAGNTLQIFNMELRAKMKSHTMTEPIVYWRWISPNTIALVTATSVMHWSIEGDSAPTQVFERHASLGSGTQIINYQTSNDSKWCLLVGIAKVNDVIQGTMQLFSVEKGVSQILQGHAGVFATVQPEGRDDPAQVLCFEEKKPDAPPRLFVMEVGRDKDAPGGVFRVQPKPIPVPSDAPNDFPVAMQVGARHDVLYMITKAGFLYLFDIHSGKALYRARISTDTIFVTCPSEASGGLLGITARKGQVLQVTVDERTLVPYVVNTLQDNQLAISLATRLNLPGADDLYRQEFARLISANDVQGAARLAASSPQNLLRNSDTIRQFQSMPAQAGQPQPVFQYFSVLLEKGALNREESLELARPVLQQGRSQLLEKWLGEDKLDCSEELGDLLLQAGETNMARSVYLRANASEKAVNCFMQLGEFDKIVDYAQKVGYRCDYTFMLQTLVRQNPQGALEFAKKLATAEGGSLVDLNQVVEIFMGVNLLRETTAFLLEALKGNKPEEGYLQTKLLEINLLGGLPQVADAIMSNNMFTHYDRPHIARLCEQAGLLQRALEHHTDTADIKRVLQNAHQMSPDFVITYFGSLLPETSLEVLRDMLGRNMRQNLNLVVQIASKYSEQVGAEALIAMFEDFKSFEGLFYYLGQIVNFSQDATVHFKYIQAAAKMQQFKEVERVCRDSQVYDPQEVKQFLMDAKLADPRPLIHVCDRYEYVEEMTGYLYSNNLLKYIEVYVQKVSPQKTPMVIGKLLDLDCNEDFVRNILNSVGHLCPVEELVEQVERRNRLRLLQPWLEALISAGNTETATHNAIGKIYITLNRDPVQFLTNNQFYDPAVLGQFCEKLDPSLAFTAYKHSGGACDDDLIRVSTSNGLFKDLARYLVERQDLELWAKVLQPEGEEPLAEGEEEPADRRALIDQVVQTALPETTDADQVSTTVKAFVNAEMPAELIELLERLVLQGSEFSGNRNLQNLLILTGIKVDKTRVMEYINRLDNFNGPEIAGIAVQEEYQLYEEAFAIYTKFGKTAEEAEEREEHHVHAVGVLVDHIHDLDRAREFAERVNNNKVWSKLAGAQLDERMLADCIASYIKAEDPSHYTEVISLADQTDEEESHGELVRFLTMARGQVKEAALDTQLIYSLARTSRLSELEEFISAPNVGNILSTGERCYNEGMYEAAKILFKSINNNAKLALCLVALEQYREAVDAATKANSISTWKEVNAACVRAGEFRLANMCGLHIIVHPDHLEELSVHYQRSGRWEELIQLMEQGLGLEGAHQGIFTELGVLYSKYKTDKLMEHIKIFHSRMNLVKVWRACEIALLWNETVYLYKADNQHDAAVRTMIEHGSCFHHDSFLDSVQKVRNPEMQYRAISFYLEQHALQLERLLQVLTPTLDHPRVVHLLRKQEALPLAVEYLKSVQKENLTAVNEALNELYIDEEDYEALRTSIDEFHNFDQIALAQQVEKHELLEFRRIAAYLYKSNKRYEQSVALSKDDKMFRDAIETAAESESSELVEELLRFFVQVQDKACFCATLHTCYDLIRPDVALELAWRHGYFDYAMPYIIQYMAHLHDRVNTIDERTAPKKEEDVAAEQAAASAAAMGGMMYGDTPLLTNGGVMPPQPNMYPTADPYMGQPQQPMPGMPGPGMGFQG